MKSALVVANLTQYELTTGSPSSHCEKTIRSGESVREDGVGLEAAIENLSAL